MNKKIMLSISCLIAGITMSGCQTFAPKIEKATAVISPTVSGKAEGIVTFTKVEEGIKIQATITGLTPGKHGFHIHEFGDISRPDGQAAGGHFNPHNHEHNGPESLQRHVGDLGNIEADNYGYAYYEAVDPQMSFSGKASVIGRAVIIHANDDDLTTQPTGDAGGRVGQGVIGISKH
jgi:Cu-Zn family superoxide dismutase